MGAFIEIADGETIYEIKKVSSLNAGDYFLALETDECGIYIGCTKSGDHEIFNLRDGELQYYDDFAASIEEVYVMDATVSLKKRIING